MFRRLLKWFRELFHNSGHRGGRSQDYTHHPLYHNLMRKAQGNKAMVERLIQHERTRNPSAGQEEWMKDAVARWERDNH